MSGKITPWQDRYYAQNSEIVRRFLIDGALDPSFIMMNNDPYFSSLQGGDYHVFPDGRVLMTGLHSINAPQLGLQGVYNLVWFFDNGRLDTTRTHHTGNGTNWTIKEIPAGTAGDLGGKFLLNTWGTQYDGHAVDKVIRVHADGSLDTTFRTHIEWGYVWDFEMLSDGRAYIGGVFRMQGGTDTLHVIRVMPDGSLDPTFNNQLDFREQQLTGVALVVSIFPIAPGLLVIGGGFEQVEGQPQQSICMIDTTGALVNTYMDGDGCGMFSYFNETYGAIYGMAQAPNGDYYIWGAYHGYTDGTTNDTLQRMITRLHGGDIGLAMAEQNSRAPLFNLYPNPSNGAFTLQLEQVPRNAQVVVRDALGREVLRQLVRDDYTTLALPHSGVYLVELWDAGGRMVTQRLAVQR